MVLTARFPSLTLSFIALNLPFMHIIKILSQCDAGKRCWVDRPRWFIIIMGMEWGRLIRSFLIEQVAQKEVLNDAKSEKELINYIMSSLGKVRGSGGNDNKGYSLQKFLWAKPKSHL